MGDKEFGKIQCCHDYGMKESIDRLQMMNKLLLSDREYDD